MVILLMGVSGAGKSTVGKLLAQSLQVEFHEGDDFHSEESRAKMSQGIPLDDQDRQPWLERLADLIASIEATGKSAVISCSALKRRYRDRLRTPGVRFVFLQVPQHVLEYRLKERAGHFFDPGLLQTQFAALEAPRQAITVDGQKPPHEIVADIRQRLAQ
jgi:gluconokinase